MYSLGHKIYKYKVKSGGEKNKEKNKKETSKLSNTYTNKVDKKATTPFLLKKNNDKVVGIKVDKQCPLKLQPHIYYSLRFKLYLYIYFVMYPDITCVARYMAN